MKTSLDCIPCFVRQTLEAARMITDHPAAQEEVLRDVLRFVAEMDLSKSPPVTGQRIHRRLREITGKADPYAEGKMRFNRMALDMLPELYEKITGADDPLAMAARLAIAGNVIDMGVNGNISENDVRQAIEQTLSEPFYGDMPEFRRSINAADRILYLADNAGEIVFDRLLIEVLGAEKVTVAVRGGPVLNDATMEDAEATGLTELVNVIDNGSDAPGTILSDCSAAFLQCFRDADLIIAKGQGNFETLSDESADIFFLFKAKCAVIAEHIRLSVGMHVLLKQCCVAT